MLFSERVRWTRATPKWPKRACHKSAETAASAPVAASSAVSACFLPASSPWHVSFLPSRSAWHVLIA
eukprot:scaffold37037_cov629-Isochrysis_galbana.AAC.1